MLSNPPYVAKRDLRHAPAGGHRRAATWRSSAGDDGFEIVRRLVPAAVERAPLVAIEVGMGMARAGRRDAARGRRDAVDVQRDLAGIERVVVGRGR